jgi:hypothetical protein
VKGDVFACVAHGWCPHGIRRDYNDAGCGVAITNIEQNARARASLIEHLGTGRLIGCTGAGVSVWAGYRDWRGVIDRLAAEVERVRRGEVNVPLVVHNNVDLLICAQRLGEYLGPEFPQFIQSEFGPIGAPVNGVLYRVAALPLWHLLTLNFDSSIERAHVAIGLACNTVTSSDRPAMGRFLRDMNEPAYPKQAVHLHGIYTDRPEQMALTEPGYAALYRDSFFRTFVWAMASKRLLFLGFGFNDTDFTGILRDCARDLRGNGLSHFAIVGVKPDKDDNQLRYMLNDRYLIEPLFYPVHVDADGTEDHSEFPELINGLATAVGVRERAIAEATPPAVPPAMPPDPDDLRRARELGDQLLGRIARGAGDV